MDTRKKILALDELLRAAAGRPILWVRGSFDPLLASHASQIAALRRPETVMAAVVSGPSQPLLAMRARAELAAALAGVDYVLADGAIPAGSEIFDLDGDGAREQFLEHVRRRHNGAGS